MAQFNRPLSTRQQLDKVRVQTLTLRTKRHGSVVNDLGVLRDSQLITLSDLTLSRSRFFYTRQVRLIKRSLTPEATKTLVHALVSSRLDYCNSVLTGLSGHLLRKLQVIQNAAARLIIPEPEDPNI